MGGFGSNEGSICFESLDACIDTPQFALSRTKRLYEANGLTTDGRDYNIIVWQQRPNQLAALVRVWDENSDNSVIVLDTADANGMYGFLVEAYTATTERLKQLKVMPAGGAASSEAKYRAVFRSISDPMSPIYHLDTTTIDVESAKASFSFD
jgi:hypothetical protein